MIEAIRKTLLAGVGAAVMTKEKAEAALGDLVRQGRITAAEASQMAEELAEKGRRDFEAFSRELSGKLRETFLSVDPESRERLAALEERVAALERRIPPPSDTSRPGA
jgi:polyhydroxyalkanoate synthesis regulator phasin